MFNSYFRITRWPTQFTTQLHCKTCRFHKKNISNNSLNFRRNSEDSPQKIIQISLSKKLSGTGWTTRSGNHIGTRPKYDNTTNDNHNGTCMYSIVLYMMTAGSWKKGCPKRTILSHPLLNHNVFAHFTPQNRDILIRSSIILNTRYDHPTINIFLGFI